MNEKQLCSQCGGSGHFCINCNNSGVTKGGTDCSCSDSKCSQCNGTGIEPELNVEKNKQLNFAKNYGFEGFTNKDLR